MADSFIVDGVELEGGILAPYEAYLASNRPDLKPEDRNNIIDAVRPVIEAVVQENPGINAYQARELVAAIHQGQEEAYKDGNKPWDGRVTAYLATSEVNEGVNATGPVHDVARKMAKAFTAERDAAAQAQADVDRAQREREQAEVERVQREAAEKGARFEALPLAEKAAVLTKDALDRFVEKNAESGGLSSDRRDAIAGYIELAIAAAFVAKPDAKFGEGSLDVLVDTLNSQAFKEGEVWNKRVDLTFQASGGKPKQNISVSVEDTVLYMGGIITKDVFVGRSVKEPTEAEKAAAAEAAFQALVTGAGSELVRSMKQDIIALAERRVALGVKQHGAENAGKQLTDPYDGEFRDVRITVLGKYPDNHELFDGLYEREFPVALDAAKQKALEEAQRKKDDTTKDAETVKAEAFTETALNGAGLVGEDRGKIKGLMVPAIANALKDPRAIEYDQRKADGFATLLRDNGALSPDYKGGALAIDGGGMGTINVTPEQLALVGVGAITIESLVSRDNRRAPDQADLEAQAAAAEAHFDAIVAGADKKVLAAMRKDLNYVAKLGTQIDMDIRAAQDDPEKLKKAEAAAAKVQKNKIDPISDKYGKDDSKKAIWEALNYREGEAAYNTAMTNAENIDKSGAFLKIVAKVVSKFNLVTATAVAAVTGTVAAFWPGKKTEGQDADGNTQTNSKLGFAKGALVTIGTGLALLAASEAIGPTKGWVSKIVNDRAAKGVAAAAGQAMS